MNLIRRLASSDFQDSGLIYTHYSPDVDSMFSMWLVYRFMKNVFDWDVHEMVNRVRFCNAADVPEYPDFGIDVGSGMSINHIKEGDFPVSINGRVYRNPCASMAIASMLLPERDFRALKDIIADVNTVDKGENTPSRNSTPNLATLWGVIAALQNTSIDFRALFVTVDAIFTSILAHSSSTREDAMMKLEDVKTMRVCDQLIAITPLNSGRQLSEKCFHELYANVVIWSSFNEHTAMGTVGFTVSKKFSGKFDIRSILSTDAMKQMLSQIGGNIYATQHLIGRTTKSPITQTTLEEINSYAKTITNEVISLIRRSADEAGR